MLYLTHRFQLRDQAIKKQSDEKRRAERKQRHLQDDLRYALKKLPEPLDLSLRYEDVSVNPFVMCMVHLADSRLGHSPHRTPSRVCSTRR